jgi:GAF domain-containing protein
MCVMAWIGVVDSDAREVRPVFHRGRANGYLDGIRISIEDVPSGRGVTGTAIRTGLSAVCNDIANDNRVKPWRSEALKRGFRSGAAFPLKAGGRAFAALTVYSSEPFHFDEERMAHLQKMADEVVR